MNIPCTFCIAVSGYGINSESKISSKHTPQNHLTVCKQMRYGFKNNVTYQLIPYKSYIYV